MVASMPRKLVGIWVRQSCILPLHEVQELNVCTVYSSVMHQLYPWEGTGIILETAAEYPLLPQPLGRQLDLIFHPEAGDRTNSNKNNQQGGLFIGLGASQSCYYQFIHVVT